MYWVVWFSIWSLVFSQLSKPSHDGNLTIIIIQMILMSGNVPCLLLCTFNMIILLKGTKLVDELSLGYWWARKYSRNSNWVSLLVIYTTKLIKCLVKSLNDLVSERHSHWLIHQIHKLCYWKRLQIFRRDAFTNPNITLKKM